jgi:hypothetical protein
LTGFALFPGIDGDDRPAGELERELRRLVDAGIDGIMTDFPEKVVPMVRRLRDSTGPRASQHG